jgi:putative phosphoribosyl transferase
LRTRHNPAFTDPITGLSQQPVRIESRPFALEGALLLPRKPRGSVIFGNGDDRWEADSTSSFLATTLQRSGFGVLVLNAAATPPASPCDDLTRFETGLLAAKIVLATDWVFGQSALRGHSVGCLAFGSAAAAAVIAATERPSAIRALVAADPRLQFATPALSSLRSPMLFVAGKDDPDGRAEAHAAAREAAGCEIDVRTVPGRSVEVAQASVRELGRLAEAWYRRHLR